jgi:hypothetical protein
MMRSTILLSAIVLGACAHAARAPEAAGRPYATPVPDTTDLPPLAAIAFADADSIQVHELHPGVRRVVVSDGRGPWTIQVVEIDTRACRPVFEVRKPAGALSAVATTSSLGADAIATINADFFSFPGGTPVGVHVERGVTFIGPTLWPAFAVSVDGEWTFGTARLHGSIRAGADSAALVQVNRSAETLTAYPERARDGVTLFTRRMDTVTADSGAHRIVLRQIEGDESAGRGVVVDVVSAATATAVGPGAVILHAHDAAVAWAARRAPGDTVTWRTSIAVPRLEGDGVLTAVEAVGGFPELLRAGRDVLGDQEVRPAFGDARHPRTALGWSRDRARFWFVVVDGRQPPYSDGMSLTELAWLFRRLDAPHALNLDGGGSTALADGTSLVSRPSDATGERAVGNALSLVRCSN